MDVLYGVILHYINLFTHKMIFQLSYTGIVFTPLLCIDLYILIHCYKCKRLDK